jgi:hypothetical protein
MHEFRGGQVLQKNPVKATQQIPKELSIPLKKNLFFSESGGY